MENAMKDFDEGLEDHKPVLGTCFAILWMKLFYIFKGVNVNNGN